MAGFKRPSFNKRLKEQKRVARANEKREARQARREAQRATSQLPESPDTPEELGLGESYQAQDTPEDPTPGA